MSQEPRENGDEPDKEVVDEENSVDQKIKTWIIETRKRVDKAEEKIFVDSATDPNVQISREEQIMTWATIVKQFLRTIEPILQEEEMKRANYYYNDVEIGGKKLHPPDTNGYEFSLLRHMEDKSDNEKRRALGLPKGADLPEPKPIVFTGLKDVIERPPVLQHQWVVTVDNRGPPGTQEEVYPRAQTVVPKKIYEDAVRKATRFLQQAGIGLEVGEEDTPIIRGFDKSGDNDGGHLDGTEYSGDPDI